MCQCRRVQPHATTVMCVGVGAGVGGTCGSAPRTATAGQHCGATLPDPPSPLSACPSPLSTGPPPLNRWSRAPSRAQLRGDRVPRCFWVGAVGCGRSPVCGGAVVEPRDKQSTDARTCAAYASSKSGPTMSRCGCGNDRSESLGCIWVALWVRYFAYGILRLSDSHGVSVRLAKSVPIYPFIVSNLRLLPFSQCEIFNGRKSKTKHFIVSIFKDFHIFSVRVSMGQNQKDTS